MKLSRSAYGEFVPVIEKDKTYYGGFQNSLERKNVSKFYRDRSCVVTAMTNVYFYLFHKERELSMDLYNEYHYYFFRSLRPRANGVPTVKSLDRRLDRVREDFDISLESKTLTETMVNKRPLTKKIVFIEEALSEDSPPIIINWLSNDIKVMKHHGVCITELNRVGDKHEVVVSSWGRVYRFILEDFERQFRTYTGLIYFKEK
ncbi:Uncharacterised protein [Anaerococcus prevotii]|uniref:Peptidase C39-like domain-containing protein n=1 Tax=Anaerococcus prevotii (strain ATCC 9321 / DSM 20548 / JCM 6508 / NCTC 11806 / PC1) TaxID=525919 RepID=C7RG50_ANAPD|nr:hypothetical protein [Anaerococcus prevotii]ACV28461.1 hypothetical protein Apre_0412 [Anaerococcus prevotii DSM 20548]SUU94020.1 Uncharacterised protein [Anaerococcus prevotii]